MGGGKRDLCVTTSKGHWPTLPVPACNSPLHEYYTCLLEWVESPHPPLPFFSPKSYTGVWHEQLVLHTSLGEFRKVNHGPSRSGAMERVTASAILFSYGINLATHFEKTFRYCFFVAWGLGVNMVVYFVQKLYLWMFQFWIYSNKSSIINMVLHAKNIRIPPGGMYLIRATSVCPYHITI